MTNMTKEEMIVTMEKVGYKFNPTLSTKDKCIEFNIEGQKGTMKMGDWKTVEMYCTTVIPSLLRRN